MKKIHVGMAMLAMAAVSAQAQDNTYDTRSIAMGGVGVASANARNAALANPAMLASAPQDKFDIEIPVFALRVMDADGLIDNLDTLNTSANALNDALKNYVPSTATGNNAATNRAIAAIKGFNHSLGLVSNKSLMGAGYVGTMLSIPSKKYAFALQLDARAEGGGVFNYVTADQTRVDALITALTGCANNNAVVCATATTLYDPAKGEIQNLESKFNVRAVVFKEVGLSFATQVKELSDINIGITPKFIQLTSYDYVLDSQSGDNKITLEQGKKDDSLFTIDVGAVKLFKTEKGNYVRAGLVAKNILSKSTTTILGNKVDIAPQLTAGGAYSTGLITAGADLDLIPNKPLLPGINKESQYLRLGAEFDAWRWAQVRIGYRHDLKGNNPGLPSIGLGLSFFGLHTDLSVAVAGKKEVAAAWQLGFNF
jgi:hypothetical protein